MTLLKQVVFDLDEFVQREGITIEKRLLRSKLLLLHQLLPKSKSKTIIRGILTRIKKLEIEIILIKLLDILNYETNNFNYIKSDRKLNLVRITTPIDILKIFEDKSFTLALEYA